MSPEESDLRAHPELYRVARGEQGVFGSPPYTDELKPLWRFATPEDARASATAITERFAAYVEAGDAGGADVAPKFLQMGFTRSRRYARHPGGRKYDADGSELPLGAEDPVKAESARVFKAAWDAAEADPRYRALRDAHRAAHG